MSSHEGGYNWTVAAYLYIFQIIEYVNDILTDHKRVIAVLGIEVIPLIALGIDLKLISLHGFLNLLLGKKVVFRRV